MCAWLIWATVSVHHIAVAKKNRRIISERLLFSKFLKIFNAVQSLSKLHKMTFTTAHFHVTTAQFVINCTLKYALTFTTNNFTPRHLVQWRIHRVSKKVAHYI